MNKSVLRAFISELQNGDQINVNFGGTQANKTGVYTVLRTRTGKGRGGSQILDLANSEGGVLTTGTSDSQFILAIGRVDGNLLGETSEAPSAHMIYPRNTDNAKSLKSAFSGVSVGQSVTLRSSVPELNGAFSVQKTVLLRGRGGQRVLTLGRPDGNTIEVWSGRHSGVVELVEMS